MLLLADMDRQSKHACSGQEILNRMPNFQGTPQLVISGTTMKG
jgi:hypothetical protein